MRLRAFVFSAAPLLAAFAFACSSGPSTSSTDQNDTSAPPRTDPPATSNQTPSNPAPSDQEEPDTDGGATDGGTSSEGGTVLTGGDGGKGCTTGSVAEAEPNDSEGAANQLPGKSGSVCGRLTTNKDADFFTFTMPADKNYLFTGYSYTSNGVSIQVTVDGQSFNAGGTPIVKPGSKYVVKVTSTNTKEVDYLFKYAFEPQ